jgi:NitT/TauT family transport system permease protein
MRLAAPWLLLLALLAGWEGACRLLALPPYLLPAPSAVLAAVAGEAPALAAAAWVTFSTALLALLAAALAAWPLALLSGASRTAEAAVRPLAVTLQVTPVVAVAPLFVIWAGLDHPDRAILALAAIVAFFPLFSGALTGLKSADPDLERLFDLYAARPVQRLLRLRLPAAVPFAFEGVKVGAGAAVIGAVVAEFTAGGGGAQGLAWKILEEGQHLRTAQVFAAVAVLGAMAAALHAAIEAAERWAVRRWRGR